MALTVVPVLTGENIYIADCVFTDDADLTGDVTHGLGAVPTFVAITARDLVAPIGMGAIGTVPLAASAITDTVVTLEKIGGAGTETAVTSPVRVEIRRHHSIQG